MFFLEGSTMSRRSHVASFVVLASLSVGAFGLAFTEPARGGGLDGAAQPAEPVRNERLYDRMEKLGEQLKALADALRAGETDDALKALEKMQKYTVESKSMTPATAAAYSGAEQAAFVAEYRKALAKLLRTLADMEITLLDGDVDATMNALRGDLLKMRRAGHQRFQD